MLEKTRSVPVLCLEEKMEKITQEELNERVAILKRFRSLLEQQRNKFREYLTVLEKQQDSINDENTEKLVKQAFTLEDPHCPHGRPVYTVISREKLFELVKRT